MSRFLRRRDADSGSASVEFAIIAPVLVLSVLSTADIGFAVHESFEIDQALRNGAETALQDPGKARVEAVLAAVDNGGGERRTDWTVDRHCACPESPEIATECSTTCGGSRPTAIFYDIEGVRSYPGILLPARDVRRAASVQVR